MFLARDLDMTKTLGIFALSLFLCYIIYNWIKTRNYPPGPRGLPLIGYVPFLGKYPNVTLWKLSKKYGDIFSFYVGPQHMICVTDFRMAKEILNLPQTLSRQTECFQFITGKAGFGGMNGEEWQEQRRFVMSSMRSQGLGRGLSETLIQECAADFVKEIQKRNGQPFLYDSTLCAFLINSSLSLLFGRHLDMEKEKDTIELTHKFGKMMMDYFTPVDLAFNNPFISKVAAFLKLKSYEDFMSDLRKFEGIFEREVNIRLQSKEKITKEAFIDCYLREIEKRKNDTKPHSFNLENLRGNLFLLFVSGQDSTMASVGWLLLLMTKFPKVQTKVCEEIDRVIGRDGVVYYDDRVKLPYTTATTYEMLRYITIGPLFTARYVSEDFEYSGYIIPKYSQIICNGWAMLHDPRYHEDPMEFKPERFLIENGTKLKKMDSYGPFSFGRRNCPGEGVATMNIYLYFVSVMQKFNIKTPDGGPPDMEYKFRAGTIPNPQKLCFIER